MTKKLPLQKLKNSYFLSLTNGEHYRFKGPDILYAGDEAGGIWCWRLHIDVRARSIEPEFMWTTHPSLICSGLKVGGISELSPANKRLMMQHGAKV